MSRKNASCTHHQEVGVKMKCELPCVSLHYLKWCQVSR